MRSSSKKTPFLWSVAFAVALAVTVHPVFPADNQPNIVIIWGDDIGQSNINAHTHGLMGYQTPNIDRIAKEGMIFTDYYAEQSCTAGRLDKALDEANRRGWVVVDMKKDWNRIYPDKARRATVESRSSD
jgi:hypothetical protein